MVKLENCFKKILEQINNLPEKLNFKIGETGNIVGVPNHVLRYWEREFPILKPEKFTNNQRIYTKKDIQILLLIKYLLYKEKFSIEGLRKHLPSYYQQLNHYKNEPQIQTINTEKKIYKLIKSLSQMRNIMDSFDQPIKKNNIFS